MCSDFVNSVEWLQAVLDEPMVFCETQPLTTAPRAVVRPASFVNQHRHRLTAVGDSAPTANGGQLCEHYILCGETPLTSFVFPFGTAPPLISSSGHLHAFMHPAPPPLFWSGLRRRFGCHRSQALVSPPSFRGHRFRSRGSSFPLNSSEIRTRVLRAPLWARVDGGSRPRTAQQRRSRLRCAWLLRRKRPVWHPRLLSGFFSVNERPASGVDLQSTAGGEGRGAAGGARVGPMASGKPDHLWPVSSPSPLLPPLFRGLRG